MNIVLTKQDGTLTPKMIYDLKEFSGTGFYFPEGYKIPTTPTEREAGAQNLLSEIGDVQKNLNEYAEKDPGDEI